MPDGHTGTVFLVDDEEMVLTALQTFLQLETAYTVRKFTSAWEALEAVKAEPVDVVVADFMMPEMDGISFLKEVRALRSPASRILLTGYADVENAIRAINEAGLYYYLEKPWDNQHLRMVIRNGMERSRLVNELSARISALDEANEELSEVRKRLIKMFL
jgi:DNA-binding NtrC family response regulator